MEKRLQENSPASQLCWYYEHQREANQRLLDSGKAAVAVSSNTVPFELIRAAGLVPIMLGDFGVSDEPGAKWLEPVFERRIRQIFNFIAGGHLDQSSSIVIPRTSEQEYKMFLYLTEMTRSGDLSARKPYLYNLLHTQSKNSETYGLEQTFALWRHLKELGNTHAAADELRASIRLGNATREAIRSLCDLRAKSQLSGVDAMRLIGAWRFVEPAEYTRLVTAAVQDLSAAAAPGGPRLLIKGLPLDNVNLHLSLEAQGAVVVAEDDWWGSRAAGEDINEAGDPVEAIFEKYYRHEPSPRLFPPEVADQWFLDHLTDVDAIVFYVPPEDDVFGWDYPRLVQAVEAKGLPHLLIDEEVHGGVSNTMDERIALFANKLK